MKRFMTQLLFAALVGLGCTRGVQAGVSPQRGLDDRTVNAVQRIDRAETAAAEKSVQLVDHRYRGRGYRGGFYYGGPRYYQPRVQSFYYSPGYYAPYGYGGYYGGYPMYAPYGYSYGYGAPSFGLYLRF